MNLVEKHAALMVKDSEVQENLLPEIIALSKDEAKQKELSENISKYAIINADDEIAKEIFKSIAR